MNKLLLLTVLIMASAIAGAQIIHIPGDYGTIQEGINAASPGDTVLVDEGTYFENIRFNGKAIIVTSNYLFSSDSSDIFNTIIDGSQASNPDSAACVMFINGEDTTSVICGLTITGGTGLSYPSLGAQHGGGICGFNAGGKIIHCNITANSVTYDNNAIGGGISFITSSGQNWVVIENSIISDNHAYCNMGLVSLGGGMYSSINTRACGNEITNNTSYCIDCEANGGGIGLNSLFTQEGLLILNNNTISHNEINGYNGFGGGIFIKYFEGNIEGNVIEFNNVVHDRYWGAGMFFTFPSNKVYITKNKVSHNTATIDAVTGAGGGMALKDGFEELFVVDANIFQYNVAEHGGGFYARDCYNMSFTNNILKYDTARVGAGLAIYHKVRKKSISTPQFANNAFVGNYAHETGGGLRLTGDQGVGLVTFNNIFHENYAVGQGKDIFNNTSSAPIHVHYSNLDQTAVGGYWMGDNNFLYNPLFIDDSCHIADSSICWEAGVSSIIIGGNTYQCPDHDIDGQYRPLNNAADVGVDEILIDRISEHGIAKNKYALHVYPNPSGGRITLEYTYPGFQEISVSILDIGGRVYQVQLPEKFGITETKMDLNLSHLPDGVYLLRLQAGDVVETAKIIIRK